MAYHIALAALADPTRRAVFERLRRGPTAVGELARGLPVSRPAVSQHLRVLEEAGLVKARWEGRRNLYSVDPRGLAPLREWLEGMWQTALESFKEALEKDVADGDDRARHQGDSRQGNARAGVPLLHRADGGVVAV